MLAQGSGTSARRPLRPREVTAAGHHRLVPVTPGMFGHTSGLVQAATSSAAAGMLFTVALTGCSGRGHGHLVPGAPVELATAGLRGWPADLFEEEGDILFEAAVADVADPGDIDGPAGGPGFPARDDPVDAAENE